VPWSWKDRAIPLLHLWAVRPVQSLSACTKVHFTLHLIKLFRDGFRIASRPTGGETLLYTYTNTYMHQ